DVFVDGRDRLKIVTHKSLIYPACALRTTIFAVKMPRYLFLDVIRRQFVGNAHAGPADRVATGMVGFQQGRWFWNAANGVQVTVTGMWHPRAMRGLVMEHEHEGLIGREGLQP